MPRRTSKFFSKPLEATALLERAAVRQPMSPKSDRRATDFVTCRAEQ